jgi:hypothetical protein
VKKRELITGKEFRRSGTAVGVLIREGEFCAKADRIRQQDECLVRKDVNETDYWLSLLQDSEGKDIGSHYLPASKVLRTDCKNARRNPQDRKKPMS